MKRDYELSKKSVEIYQNIYYFHYKPLIKQNLDRAEIFERLKPVLEEFEWTYRQFEDFQSIDFMQRMVFEHSMSLVEAGLASEPMTSYPEYRQYDPNYGALRLKNNLLSEDPDQFN